MKHQADFVTALVRKAKVNTRVRFCTAAQSSRASQLLEEHLLRWFILLILDGTVFCQEMKLGMESDFHTGERAVQPFRSIAESEVERKTCLLNTTLLGFEKLGPHENHGNRGRSRAAF